jgi:hypothetical protein
MRRSTILFATPLMLSFNANAQFMDDTPETLAPAPAGIEPVIPLDKDDPTYDLWKLRR